MGLEPTTFGTTIRHSNQLSYTHHFCNSIFFKFGWIMGLEPTTFGTTIRHSNQLSYTHRFFAIAVQRYVFYSSLQ